MYAKCWCCGHTGRGTYFRVGFECDYCTYKGIGFKCQERLTIKESRPCKRRIRPDRLKIKISELLSNREQALKRMLDEVSSYE